MQSVKEIIMKLINLTPHDINIITTPVIQDTITNHYFLAPNIEPEITVIKSSGIARCKQVDNYEGSLVLDNGYAVPIHSLSFKEITGLPKPEKDTRYIVSAIVLNAAKAAGRTDCMAVTYTVYDDQGHIIGCAAFSV